MASLAHLTDTWVISNLGSCKQCYYEGSSCLGAREYSLLLGYVPAGRTSVHRCAYGWLLEMPPTNFPKCLYHLTLLSVQELQSLHFLTSTPCQSPDPSGSNVVLLCVSLISKGMPLFICYTLDTLVKASALDFPNEFSVFLPWFTGFLYTFWRQVLYWYTHQTESVTYRQPVSAPHSFPHLPSSFAWGLMSLTSLSLLSAQAPTNISHSKSLPCGLDASTWESPPRGTAAISRQTHAPQGLVRQSWAAPQP